MIRKRIREFLWFICIFAAMASAGTLWLNSAAQGQSRGAGEGIFGNRTTPRTPPVYQPKSSPTPTPSKQDEKSMEEYQQSAPGASKINKISQALALHSLPDLAAVDPIWRKKITVVAEETPIGVILQQIAVFNGLNIVTTENIDKPLTLNLTDIPVLQAFDVILLRNGLTYDIVGNLVVIKKFEEDFITREFQLNYANIDRLREILPKMVSPGGWVEFEPNTNLVVARSAKADIDDITRVVRKVDLPPLQVMIEVKVVEVRSDFWKNSGVVWGPAAGQNFYKDDVGRPANEGGPADIVTGKFNFPGPSSTLPPDTMSVGFVWDHVSFDAAISLLNSQGLARVVTCPRMAVINGETERLHKGVEIVYNMRTSSTGFSNVASSEFRQIGTLLEVTPHIAPNGDVTMKLNVELSDVIGSILSQNPPLSVINAETTLRIKDRRTAVISGLIARKQEHLKGGVPGLNKIPVLGNLFRHGASSANESEIIFLVTPRVIWKDQWPDGDVDKKILQFLTPSLIDEREIQRRFSRLNVEIERYKKSNLLKEKYITQVDVKANQLLEENNRLKKKISSLTNAAEKTAIDKKTLQGKVRYYEEEIRREERQKKESLEAQLVVEEARWQKVYREYLNDNVRQIQALEKVDPKLDEAAKQYMAAMRDIDRRIEEDSRRLSLEAIRDAKQLEAELKKADAEARAMYGKFEEEEKRNRDIEIEIKVKRKHEKGN